MTDSMYHLTLADALTKCSWGVSQPTSPLESVQTLTLRAVRNEVTGFQVQITAPDDFVLVVDKTNWLHPLGFFPRLRLEVQFPSLPAGAVEVFTVGYVEGDDRRSWMETLERCGWAEVPANRPQAVYVRLRLPANLPPGTHTGTIYAYAQQGFADETRIWESAVRLEVSAITLPDPQDFRFHLNLWQHLTSIARNHRVSLWSEDHFTLIDRYFSSLSQLGQKVVSIVAAELPWSGQRCFRDHAYPSYLFEHAAVNVSRTAQGELRFDFSILDRLLALAEKHHMAQQIDLFGLLNVWVDEEYGFGKVAPDAPDAIRVRCYDEAQGCFTYLRSAADLRCFIRALHDHLDQLGVLDRVRIAADEPADLEKFNTSLAFLREAAPGFRYNAAINHYEFIEDAPPQVSDFIPKLDLAARDAERTAQLTRRIHQNGGLMLWYVCCNPPIPNTFLHSPLVEGRLIGWLTHYLGLDGFLRWAFCLWPADPWRRVSWRAPHWAAGDMYFVLPGNDGAPVETLRYEALRMAVQDYELLSMAKDRLNAEQARQVFDQAFAAILKAEGIESFGEVNSVKAESLYSLEPEDYHQARRLVVEALEAAG